VQPDNKKTLVLSALKRRTKFKVFQNEEVDTGASLSIDGVYEISRARGDHGKKVKVVDLRTTRCIERSIGPVRSSQLLEIPMERAREIRVYEI
jgi:hypothetical protein